MVCLKLHFWTFWAPLLNTHWGMLRQTTINCRSSPLCPVAEKRCSQLVWVLTLTGWYQDNPPQVLYAAVVADV
jgi:hypothetical protein